jgi:hypothetical protein
MKRPVMRRAALAVLSLLAVSSLATGCAGMGTKRPTSGGGSIQRTAEPAQTIDSGSPFDARPELGQR